MSPMPRLRATSTSMNGSSVNDERPSTSEGWIPASSSAALIARHAISSSVAGSDLANAVWPIPAIAVLSFRSKRLPALELGRPPLDERRHPLARVVGRVGELLGVGLVPEGARAVGLERAVGEPLGEPDRLGGARCQPFRPLGDGLLELGARHDLVDEADALGVGRAQVVA